MIRYSDIEQVKNVNNKQILTELLEWQQELNEDIIDNIIVETLDTVASIILDIDYKSES